MAEVWRGALSAMGMSGSAQKIAGQASGDRGKYQEKMLQPTMQHGSFAAMPTPHIESNNAKRNNVLSRLGWSNVVFIVVREIQA